MRHLLPIPLLLLGGCTDDAAMGPGDPMDPMDPMDPADPTADFAPPPAPGVQISSGEIDVGAGEESTICVFVDLPTDDLLQVTRLDQRNRGYSHHFIVFAAAEPREPGVGPCPGDLFTDSPPVFPGTRDADGFDMPEGVALPLAAGQTMIIQLHLLNASDTPAKERIVINLHGGDPTASWQRAGIVGGSDFNFEIPPNSDHTETQRCRTLPLMNLFMLTSHSHARTVSFDVSVLRGDVAEPVYHSADWADPAVTEYTPVIEVPALGGFEFSCTWKNGDDAPVIYGGSASDEMCMFFGYYYPAEEAITPCVGV